jgi:hypothetical protein
MKHFGKFAAALSGIIVIAFAFGNISTSFAEEPAQVTHHRVATADHIAARHFCLGDMYQEKKLSKLSEERFLQLAHLCSKGHFNRAFTELGGNPKEGLVVHKGDNGLEVMHSWERAIRSAIAKAPHLEMK